MSIGPWDFNGFDIVVLLILLISLLYAANRGLMRELTSILALFIAASVALFVYGQYRFAAQDLISPSWLADGALGLGAFSLAYMIMVFLLSGLVKKLKGKEIGFIDRLLGAGFGVARGLVVASLGVMLLTSQYRASQDAQYKTPPFIPYSPKLVMVFGPCLLRKCAHMQIELKMAILNR